LVLIGGGLFLIWKSTGEIHQSFEGDEEHAAVVKAKFYAVIAQVIVVAMVFSLDSIITAVGMVDQLAVMIAAIVASVALMMLFSAAIGRFVNTHPTIKMLALAFLVVVGVMLLVEGFGQHVPKGYIYFAMAFSVCVEMLNIRMRKRSKKPAQLESAYADDPAQPWTGSHAWRSADEQRLQGHLLPLAQFALGRHAHLARGARRRLRAAHARPAKRRAAAGRVPRHQSDGQGAGDRAPGALITEQGAVYTYLADLHPEAGITPAIGDALRGPYLRWLFFYGSSYEPALIDRSMKREPALPSTSPYGDYDTMLKTLFDQFEQGPYLLGERFTAADVLWGTALRWTTMFKLVAETPVVKAYIERVTSRPAA